MGTKGEGEKRRTRRIGKDLKAKGEKLAPGSGTAGVILSQAATWHATADEQAVCPVVPHHFLGNYKRTPASRWVDLLSASAAGGSHGRRRAVSSPRTARYSCCRPFFACASSLPIQRPNSLPVAASSHDASMHFALPVEGLPHNKQSMTTRILQVGACLCPAASYKVIQGQACLLCSIADTDLGCLPRLLCVPPHAVLQEAPYCSQESW